MSVRHEMKTIWYVDVSDKKIHYSTTQNDLAEDEVLYQLWDSKKVLVYGSAYTPGSAKGEAEYAQQRILKGERPNTKDFAESDWELEFREL